MFGRFLSEGSCRTAAASSEYSDDWCRLDYDCTCCWNIRSRAWLRDGRDESDILSPLALLPNSAVSRERLYRASLRDLSFRKSARPTLPETATGLRLFCELIRGTSLRLSLLCSERCRKSLP